MKKCGRETNEDMDEDQIDFKKGSQKLCEGLASDLKEEKKHGRLYKSSQEIKKEYRNKGIGIYYEKQICSLQKYRKREEKNIQRQG